jgi:rhomboid protease GluP
MARFERASRASCCPRCGALNGVEFDRCIRCGTALSTRAASVDVARGHLDGRSLLGTKMILGATSVIFTLQLAAAIAQKQSIFGVLTFTPVRDTLRFGAILVSTEAVVMEPWRLLSAIFVHYSGLHFAMNMLSLASLGRTAESAVGTARFVIAYVVTGFVGFAATMLYAALHGGSYGSTAGASGAVLGVMGVILGWLIRRRDPRWKGFAVQALVYGVLFGFMVNRSNAGILVNNSAHIGGLLCGTILGVIFAGARPRSDLRVNVLAALGVVVSVASILLPHWSPLAERRRFSSDAPPALAPVSSKDAAASAEPGPSAAPPG